MSFNTNIKTLGFNQMHPEQVSGLMDLIDAALNLAASVDDEVFEEMHQIAEDTVIIFGGLGIKVDMKVDY
tara:strand:+ start:6198 stop:6407 length:210 start_codon:yes stop_codon:yes gene_type:complete